MTIPLIKLDLTAKPQVPGEAAPQVATPDAGAVAKFLEAMAEPVVSGELPEDVGCHRLRSLVLEPPVVESSAVKEPEVGESCREQPIAVDAGREWPVAVDAGRERPVVVDVGREQPIAVDAGREWPVAVDAGRERPVAVGTGRERPVAIDAGRERPVAVEQPVAGEAPMTKLVAREQSIATTPVAEPAFVQNRDFPEDHPEAPVAIDGNRPQPLAFEAPVVQTAASADSARTVEVVDRVVQTAASAEIVAQAAGDVADAILVTPGLERGRGEILIRLKPDVLDGTEVRIEVTGRSIQVEFLPEVHDVAVLIERNLAQLQQHLAARVPSFDIGVAVGRGVTFSRFARKQDKDVV